MQTFMPYDSFTLSLRCLDDKRLGKQRVEAKQIINAIRNGGGWANHPATAMWRDNVDALIAYHNEAIRQWVGRGFNNTMEQIPLNKSFEFPWWMGWAEFHNSHRSNLLRKAPGYYSQFDWVVESDLPYIWPAK